MRLSPTCQAFALAIASACFMPAHAGDFFQQGQWLFDARLRLEKVDDAAFAADATALTLRTRLGWRSGSVHGLYLLVEAEDVRALDESYNSTANGRTRYPVVADPEGSEWNQFHLGWDSGHGTLGVLGRQRLLFDNQRFIGNVGWRQNEQTFDALSVSQAIGSNTTLRYAWLDKVHRVFGNNHPNPLQAEHDLNAHLLNIAYKAPIGTLSGYNYSIENQDLPATSTRSSGLRLVGNLPLEGAWGWQYAAEFATQRGIANAPATGEVSYVLAEAGLRYHGHGARIGTEVLGSNGRRAFQTPLATGHAFNGWADRFLVTPLNGLRDRYIKFDGPLGALRYMVAYHDFDADRGGASLGRELDLQLTWAFAPKWNAIAKMADYRDAGRDLRKAWLSVEYRY
jgi:hypothetical protein